MSENSLLLTYSVIALYIFLYFVIIIITFELIILSPSFNPDGLEARWIPSVFFTKAYLSPLARVAFVLPAFLWPIFFTVIAFQAAGRAIRDAAMYIWNVAWGTETCCCGMGSRSQAGGWQRQQRDEEAGEELPEWVTTNPDSGSSPSTHPVPLPVYSPPTSVGGMTIDHGYGAWDSSTVRRSTPDLRPSSHEQ